MQVGDPFQEKKLLEACLEVIKTGAVVGMQDMGAAGIICSTAEMSAKGESGMRIDLEHQFFLPILAYLIEASRSEMSAPFSKIINFAMEKLLGSDVHEIAFARLIEALD